MHRSLVLRDLRRTWSPRSTYWSRSLALGALSGKVDTASFGDRSPLREVVRGAGPLREHSSGGAARQNTASLRHRWVVDQQASAPVSGSPARGLPSGRDTGEPLVSTPISHWQEGPEVSLDLRAPQAGDAANIWCLVSDARTLDVNSPYAYLLVCSHFAATSVVAEDRDGDGLAGFVAAYRLPDDPGVLFVWQIGVSSDRRTRGLGLRLLTHMLHRPGNRGVRYVHATVTPSNRASDRLFRSFARSLGAPWTTAEHYPSDLFPGEGHEPEVLYRIGPFTTPIQEVTTTQ